MVATAVAPVGARRRHEGTFVGGFLLALAAAIAAGTLLWVVAIVCAVTPLSGLSRGSTVPATIVPSILQLDVTVTPGTNGPVCGHAGPASVSVVPIGIRLLSPLGIALEASGVVVGLIAIRRVVDGIAAGRPFSAQVLSSMRVSGYALLAGTLLRSVCHLAATLWVASWVHQMMGRHGDHLCEPNAFGIALPFYVSWPLVIAGLAALCLLTAFRQGAQLEEDAVGVV